MNAHVKHAALNAGSGDPAYNAPGASRVGRLRSTGRDVGRVPSHGVWPDDFDCVPFPVASKQSEGGSQRGSTVAEVERRLSVVEELDSVVSAIHDLPCEAEMVVARKIPALFEKQHHGREEEFYADLLAHLIKNRLKRAGTLVLNMAERGSSTREKVLTNALYLATDRAARKWGAENLEARAVFNVQSPRTEPLLTVSDYLCWAVQRVFETGEVRHYNYLAKKIRLVVDLYDRDKYEGYGNYYDKNNPLTAKNKLGPPVA